MHVGRHDRRHRDIDIPRNKLFGDLVGSAREGGNEALWQSRLQKRGERGRERGVEIVDDPGVEDRQAAQVDLGKARFGGRDRRGDAMRVQAEHLPRRGEQDRSLVAVEQLGADALFERSDLLRHVRFADAELLRRGGHRPRLFKRDEGAQAAQCQAADGLGRGIAHGCDHPVQRAAARKCARRRPAGRLQFFKAAGHERAWRRALRGTVLVLPARRATCPGLLRHGLCIARPNAGARLVLPIHRTEKGAVFHCRAGSIFTSRGD